MRLLKCLQRLRLLQKNNLFQFPFSFFVVKEESMEPSFLPGDHVIVFAWSKVKSGDVVVFNYENNKHIKRVKKNLEDGFFVEGDNKPKSAKYKMIKKEELLGKVIFKY